MLRLFHRRHFQTSAAAAASEFIERKEVFTTRLRKCAESGLLADAITLHEELVASGFHRDIFLSNLVIFMYGKCGDLQSAKAAFDSSFRKNVVTWTVLLGAYAQAGHYHDALELFKKMNVLPSNATLVTMLGVCTSLGIEGLEHGKAVHARVLDHENLIVSNSLLNMYAKCGSIEDAIKVFHNAAKRDVISWTTMVKAFTFSGRCSKALEAFNKMTSVNEVTFITALGACSNVNFLLQGREIHARLRALAATKNVLLVTALLNMYGKCGSSHEAREIFDNMTVRDVVAWNAMLAAYAQKGEGKEALAIFRKMDLEGVKQDYVSFLSVLDGFSCMGNEGLTQGRIIHARILAAQSSLLHSSVRLGNTLVNMYGRCGSLMEARQVFVGMGTLRDAISWAALIAAYAHHGHWQETREVFRDMELEGMEPPYMVFISILSSCSHAGLLGEARWYFLSMVEDHGIQPITEHYACILDSFGRVGRLDESEELISSMPYEPGGLQWRCFLGACTTHFDGSKGVGAAELASKLEPQHGAAYVMMSSIFRHRDEADQELNKSIVSYRPYGL